MSGKVTVGGQRLQILGEKLLWFHENLNVILNSGEEGKESVTKQDMLELIDAYIIRNQEELEQIKLKNSIGSGQFRKRNQHQGTGMNILLKIEKYYQTKKLCFIVQNIDFYWSKSWHEISLDLNTETF